MEDDIPSLLNLQMLLAICWGCCLKTGIHKLWSILILQFYNEICLWYFWLISCWWNWMDLNFQWFALVKTFINVYLEMHYNSNKEFSKGCLTGDSKRKDWASVCRWSWKISKPFHCKFYNMATIFGFLDSWHLMFLFVLISLLFF